MSLKRAISLRYGLFSLSDNSELAVIRKPLYAYISSTTT
jgi:hypothetical protein